jgi:hypothetical protein
MNLRINAESSGVHVNAEESLESYGDSNTRENTDSIAYAFTEVATLNGKDDEYIFRQQEQVNYLDYYLDTKILLKTFSLDVPTTLEIF